MVFAPLLTFLKSVSIVFLFSCICVYSLSLPRGTIGQSMIVALPRHTHMVLGV